MKLQMYSSLPSAHEAGPMENLSIPRPSVYSVNETKQSLSCQPLCLTGRADKERGNYPAVFKSDDVNRLGSFIPGVKEGIPNTETAK